jgi:hypothetical protein
MKNKNLLIALRVTYMFGGPFVAIYLNKIIGNKICFFALITLLTLLIANALYQKVKPSNSDTVKAWLYRLCVWVIGILLAQFIELTFGGILIYVMLFIFFLFTFMDEHEVISFVEDFVSDKKIVNLILVFSILLISITIYTLATKGYDGLIHMFQNSQTITK